MPFFVNKYVKKLVYIKKKVDICTTKERETRDEGATKTAGVRNN